jgi:hypothetical protein
MEPGGRGGVEDADEILEVFPHDDVERHLKSRLLAIGPAQRRPVPLGEQRQREGDRQECDRRYRGSWTSREPDRSEPRGDAAAPTVRPPASRRREDPSDEDRRRESDEAGQQQ